MSNVFRESPSRLTSATLYKQDFGSGYLIADEFFTDTVIWTPPTTALNTPANASSTEDTTPTFNFTGTSSDSRTIEYHLQVDNVNTFNSIVEPFNLASIVAPMNKSGSPTDTFFIDIYKGLYNGILLGTSDAMSSASLTTTFTDTTINFTTPIPIDDNTTEYFMLCRRTSSYDLTNLIRFVASNIDPYEYGQYYYSNSNANWYPLTTFSLDFKLLDEYGNIKIFNGNKRNLNASVTGYYGNNEAIGQSFRNIDGSPIIDVISQSDIGFMAGHPFTSASAIDYIVQSDLSAGTYYWRVRSKDATGPILYGSWSETRSITISAGISTQVNIGGVWKTVASRSVKIGGVWKTVTAVSTKVGGVWKDEA